MRDGAWIPEIGDLYISMVWWNNAIRAATPRKPSNAANPAKRPGYGMNPG